MALPLAARARLARAIVAAELPVLLAISPALLFPTPRRLLVLAVVPVVWWCARLAGDRAVPRTPIDSALWLMLAMVAVSLYVTVDRPFSLIKVSGLVLSVLLYWAVTRVLTTPTRLKIGTAAFVLAGSGLAIVGLLGTDFGLLGLDTPAKIPALGAIAASLPRVIRGVPGADEGFNPNALAGGVVLFVPLQVALLAGRAHRWLLSEADTPWPAWLPVAAESILLAITAGTLLLTQSRSAWLGLVVAALVVLLWQSWRTRVAAVAVAIVLAAFAVSLGTGGRANPSPSGWSRAVTIRMEFWSSGLRAIRDFPLTGTGMNGFRKLMPTRYPTSLTQRRDMAHAHNSFLQAALDLGIPGLVAYTAVWLVTSVLVLAVYRRSRDQIYRILAGGLGTGLIAHLVFGITDAIPLGSKIGVLFWLAIGLAVGLHRVALAD